MREIQCNTCGSNHYEKRRIDYLYSHQGKYLLVPNTPVEICVDCGDELRPKCAKIKYIGR
ncbi:MAG: YgiT-type zinc finger protein [Phormidium sp.]